MTEWTGGSKAPFLKEWASLRVSSKTASKAKMVSSRHHRNSPVVLTRSTIGAR